MCAIGYGFDVFAPAGAQRDLRDIEIHMPDAGHFTLQAHHHEIADLIREFLTRKLRA